MVVCQPTIWKWITGKMLINLNNMSKCVFKLCLKWNTVNSLPVYPREYSQKPDGTLLVGFFDCNPFLFTFRALYSSFLRILEINLKK